MNDEKFLELMNLYIDGELQGGDLVELEDELISNPKRRELYLEYCRIHSATRAYHGVDSAMNPDQSAANIRAVQKVVRGEHGQHTGKVVSFPVRWIGWAAGVAAAFVVGFVGLQQLGIGIGIGETTTASDERPAMTVRETHSFGVSPTRGLFVTQQNNRQADGQFYNQQPRPVSLLRFDPGEDPIDPSDDGVYIQNYLIRIQRSDTLNVGTVFGFEKPVPTSGPRVFRSSLDDNDLQLEPVGYRISR